jgi:hypothetical protein
MTMTPTRRSADRASVYRKRALRRLAREFPAAYADLYKAGRASGMGRDQARGHARTQLGHGHWARYQELYFQESKG